MAKKQITFLVILLVSVVVVSGCGKKPQGNEITQNNNQERNQKQENQNNENQGQENQEIKPLMLEDVKEWRNYKNNKLGVELEYPKNWFFLEELEYPRVHFYYDGKIRDQFYPFDYGEAIWIQKISKVDWIKNKTANFEKITIDGISGKIYKHIPGGQEPGSTILFMDEIVIQKNDYFYLIELYFKRPRIQKIDDNVIKSEWLQPVDQKVFDKILSTFMFIE
jgi:hypothetical protein